MAQDNSSSSSVAQKRQKVGHPWLRPPTQPYCSLPDSRVCPLPLESQAPVLIVLNHLETRPINSLQDLDLGPVHLALNWGCQIQQIKFQNAQLSLNFRKTTHSLGINISQILHALLTSMEHTHTEKLFIVDLRFKRNWVLCFIWQP